MLERETCALASEEALTRSLESARSWSKNELGRYVRGVVCKFNYDIFRFIIDNEQMSDMCLDPKEEGLIRVSQKQLDFIKRRQEAFSGMIGAAEVDPESIFVHEITEFIVDIDTSVYLQNCVPLTRFPHDVACIVENANRKERGLKPWFHY
ncbi:hypothetical protein MUP46_04245 [Patescibacteria group bacterium]|nr:hypothetical protein [Patescibacteria group bacterium]